MQDHPVDRQLQVGSSKTLQVFSKRDTLPALTQMLAQTMAYFPNQTIPQPTAQVWLEDWIQIAEEYGIERFKAALVKTRRQPGRAFLPLPGEVEKVCEEDAREARQRASTQRSVLLAAWEDALLEDLKRRCAKEREEEALHGAPPKTELEKKIGEKLDAILNAKEGSKNDLAKTL